MDMRQAGAGIFNFDDGADPRTFANTTVCCNVPDVWQGKHWQCLSNDWPIRPCKGFEPCPSAPTYCQEETYVCGPDYQCVPVPPGAPPGPYDRKECEKVCHPPKAGKAQPPAPM